MDGLWIILAIGFWVLAALAVICLMTICHIKLTYYKWDKDEKELDMMINIAKNINSDYSGKN